VSNRFFRTIDSDLYESIRLQLDAAWGHPTPGNGTITCFDSAADAPRDSGNAVLLAVRAEFAEYPAAAAALPGLLASGAVTEITEADYRAAVEFPSPVS
jgi:hypothetical protein